MPFLTDSTLAKNAGAIHNALCEVVNHRRLLISAALYAMAGIPISPCHLPPPLLHMI
jgi:hypothetical protein